MCARVSVRRTRGSYRAGAAREARGGATNTSDVRGNARADRCELLQHGGGRVGGGGASGSGGCKEAAKRREAERERDGRARAVGFSDNGERIQPASAALDCGRDRAHHRSRPAL